MLDFAVPFYAGAPHSGTLRTMPLKNADRVLVPILADVDDPNLLVTGAGPIRETVPAVGTATVRNVDFIHMS